MAKIKAKEWHGGKLIVVPQKKLTFGYLSFLRYLAAARDRLWRFLRSTEEAGRP